MEQAKHHDTSELQNIPANRCLSGRQRCSERSVTVSAALAHCHTGTLSRPLRYFHHGAKHTSPGKCAERPGKQCRLTLPDAHQDGTAVPRVQNSNETEHSEHITKQGNKVARTALVQCALIAKRYSSFLQKFYQRIQRRRGGGKTNIALTRKLLGVIYHTLKNNWVFEDFPNFVLAS
jgi:Transposase IS116/IS110/IS902 family